MEKRYQNKTYKIGGDIEINRFGYGAMRLTGKGIIGPPKNEAKAIKVLQKAVDLGVNFIDTADSYGPNVSEELIARALYPYPEDLLIATKGGQDRPGPDKWKPNGRPEHLEKVLKGSLSRLKLDRIGLYQLHRRDPEVPFDETLGYLKEAQDEGLIRYLGLSELDIDSVKEAQKQIEVVSLQNKYSLNYRKWEPELKFCAKNDIAFIPWNPINAGNLVEDERVEKIADKYDASVAQLTLKWLFNHGGNILLIPGTSHIDHLEENWAAQEVDLDQEDYETLTQIFADQ